MKIKINISLISLIILSSLSLLNAKDYKISSPDNNITVIVAVDEDITYSIIYKSKTILNPSIISLILEDKELGKDAVVINESTTSKDEILYPQVKVKRKEERDNYKELKLDFKLLYSITFRVYNDGIGYRFSTSIKEDIKIVNERSDLNFSNNDTAYFSIPDCSISDKDNIDCFHTSYENVYTVKPLTQLQNSEMTYLPLLVDINKGPKVLFTETNLENYPGLFFKRSEKELPNLEAIFPKYPLSEKQVGGYYAWNAVDKRADFIADTYGERDYPWRIMLIAENDKQLIESNIVYRFSSKSKIDDISWFKPGKSTSEWLIHNNIYGVDFRAGYNTETYKYYIDFASEFGLEYVLFDAGWSKIMDILDFTPEMDMEYLVKYAKEKNVGLVLWTSGFALEKQMEPALDKFEEWGIKGIMVDFINRDDQLKVNFVYKVAEEAAKRKIFVDFHGVYKPTGIIREYPNIVTQEALVALENDKWSDILSPEYDVSVPFIRMVAGPIDYEPGCMKNAQKKDFYACNDIPMSQGTRVHQLAMLVVFESPYAKLGGNPSDYIREPKVTSFLAKIPTVWDETKVLDAKLADYVVIMRKAENGDHYIGAMTDWTARDIEIDLSFLGDGEYMMEIIQDGINADRYAMDYKMLNSKVPDNRKLKIHMAPGGGWVARVYKK